MINGLDFISLAFYISQFVFFNFILCIYIYIYITHTYIIFIYEIFYVSSVSSLFPSTSGTVHNVRNDEASYSASLETLQSNREDFLRRDVHLGDFVFSVNHRLTINNSVCLFSKISL